jgi:hypothetical protein
MMEHARRDRPDVEVHAMHFPCKIMVSSGISLREKSPLIIIERRTLESIDYVGE